MVIDAIHCVRNAEYGADLFDSQTCFLSNLTNQSFQQVLAELCSPAGERPGGVRVRTAKLVYQQNLIATLYHTNYDNQRQWRRLRHVV